MKGKGLTFDANMVDRNYLAGDTNITYNDMNKSLDVWVDGQKRLAISKTDFNITTGLTKTITAACIASPDFAMDINGGIITKVSGSGC